MGQNDDEDVNLKINLDDSNFNATLSKAKESISELGSGESLKGAVDHFSNMKRTLGEIAEGGSLESITGAIAEFGPLLAAAGIALYAFKKSFEMTLEGEQIEAVGREFDLLASNAGLAGDALKEAFLKSTDGLLTETDALKVANSAIIRLGASAKQLPELMEMARKSAIIMGTDLTTAFTNITNAVASGNKRMLRRVGLSVDVAAAERKYAHQLGIAENALSQAGKTQAILNAVLEEGAKKFNGVSESMMPVTTTWQQFKTAIAEVGETVSVIFEKTLGPSFQGWLTLVTEAAKATKNFFVENFGTGADAAALKVKRLEDTMRGLASNILGMEKLVQSGKPKESNFWLKFIGLDYSSSNVQKVIASMKTQYEEIRKERDKLIAETSKSAEGSSSSGKGAELKTQAVDNQKLLQNESAFQKEMTALAQTTANQKKQMAQTDLQLAQAETAQKQALQQKFVSELSAINTRKDLNDSQKRKLTAQVEQNYVREIEQYEDESLKRRTAMLDNFQNHAKGTYQGLARAAEVSSKKSADDLVDSAKLGEQAFQSLSAGVENAFQEMGKGAAGGSSMIEHAILGALGSVAAEYGAAMMLASVWPFEPDVFAAGAALEVLAGALGAIGSSSPSAASIGSSASAASGAQSSALSNNTSGGSTPVSTAGNAVGPHKSIVINVQGSVFDSQQTGMRMVDLIRQASDNTDYAYVQIGNKPYGT